MAFVYGGISGGMTFLLKKKLNILALLIPLFGLGIFYTAGAQTPQYSVAFTKTTAEVGDSLIVNWKAPASRQDGSWVGVYLEGAPDTQYNAFQYLPNTGTSGQLNFTINTAGTYEARIFSDNTYTRAGVSNNINIKAAGNNDGGNGGNNGGGNGGNGNFNVRASKSTYNQNENININWQAPASRQDNSWVGIYLDGAPDTQYNAFQYLPNTGTSGQLSFNLNAAKTD